AVDFLDTGDGALGQEREDAGEVGRRPVGEPQVYRTGNPRALVAAGRGAQLARRGGVDLPDGVVELANAGEPRGERDLGHRHGRRLQQGPGGVGTLRTGQPERPGADLLGERTVHLPLAVTQLPGQAGHAVAVDHAVSD